MRAAVWALAGLLGAPAAAAAPPTVVAVVPIGGDADGGSRLEATATLERALGGLEGVEVVSLRGLDALVGADALEALLACGEDDACLRRGVARVRTDHLVAGTLDAERNLRLRLVDSATTAGPPRVRVSRQVGYSDAELRQGVTAAALELFPERADAAFGTLALEGGEPGARVLVDGEEAGAMSLEAPPRAVLRVRAGARDVRVLAPGHEAFEARADVLLGQTARLQVELTKNRSPGPLFLAGGGAVALGVATALAFAVQARADDWEAGCPTGMACAEGFTRARYESDGDFVTGGRWAANSLFVVGGAALVGAAVWYLLDPGQEAE